MDKRNTSILLFIIFILIIIYSIVNFTTQTAKYGNGSNLYSNGPKAAQNQKLATYWTGLPISSENPFFIEPTDYTQQYYQAYLQEFIDHKDVAREAKVMDAIYEKYYQHIGLNGLIDGLNDEKEIATSAVRHHIGEFIYSKVNKQGNLRYGVEIVSRNILTDAPLHSYIWSIVADHLLRSLGIDPANYDLSMDMNHEMRKRDGDMDHTHMEMNNHETGLSHEEMIQRKEDLVKDKDFLKHFFQLIDEICYFKEMDYFLYESCLHGVGHGITKVYNNDEVHLGLQICEYRDAPVDFQYLCATGIYMDIDNDFKPTKWEPCDESPYPGACFRFANKKQQLFQYKNIKRPCDAFKSRYYSIGCVWGLAFGDRNKSFQSTRDYCDEYKVPFYPPLPLSVFNTTDLLDNPQLYLNNLKDAVDEDYLMFQNRKYLACVDGMLWSLQIWSKKRKSIEYACGSLKSSENGNYFSHYCITLTKKLKNLYDTSTFKDEEFIWGYKLLELDYDPTYVPRPVKFPL